MTEVDYKKFREKNGSFWQSLFYERREIKKGVFDTLKYFGHIQGYIQVIL